MLLTYFKFSLLSSCTYFLHMVGLCYSLTGAFDRKTDRLWKETLRWALAHLSGILLFYMYFRSLEVLWTIISPGKLIMLLQARSTWGWGVGVRDSGSLSCFPYIISISLIFLNPDLVHQVWWWTDPELHVSTLFTLASLFSGCTAF